MQCETFTVHRRFRSSETGAGKIGTGDKFAVKYRESHRKCTASLSISQDEYKLVYIISKWNFGLLLIEIRQNFVLS